MVVKSPLKVAQASDLNWPYKQQAALSKATPGHTSTIRLNTGPCVHGPKQAAQIIINRIYSSYMHKLEDSVYNLQHDVVIRNSCSVRFAHARRTIRADFGRVVELVQTRLYEG